MKILCNAEAFGFGPAAAIASVASHLKGVEVDYIGSGHTLDLQTGVPYGKVHEIPRDSRTLLTTLAPDYDYFLTAMDYKMAEAAIEAGLATIMIDCLIWYWRELPRVLPQLSLLIAQDFFGVAERLARQESAFSIVPPMVTRMPTLEREDFVLLNLGGLQNPLWSKSYARQFAKAIIGAVKEAVSAHIVVTTSHAIARGLWDAEDTQVEICTANYEQMKGLLTRASLALMTPGLGNIYDAAASAVPVVWLPPANTSQGQQLLLLTQYGFANAHLDWATFAPPVDYQQQISEKQKQSNIVNRVGMLINSLQTQQAFSNRVGKAIEEGLATVPRTPGLLEKFGTGGVQAAVDIMHQHLEKGTGT